MNEYYLDKTRVSNSAIGWFLKSPKEYYERNNNGLSMDSAAMRFGTALHCYILQRDEFKRIYRVRDFEVPTLKQQKDFCYKFIEYRKSGKESITATKNDAIKAYSRSYSIAGKSEKVIYSSAIDMLLKYKTFIQQETNEERIYLTWSQFRKIVDLQRLAIKNDYARPLLAANGDCEFHINWTYNGVHCKSLLDKVCIDKDSKTITLIDLKTTASIANFKHSVIEYGYRRQMMFYRLAIRHYMKNILLENPDDYTFQCRIIALQTGDIPLVEVFGFSEKELEKELPIIEDSLKRIDWHQQNNVWEHNKEYYEGDGIIDLVID